MGAGPDEIYRRAGRLPLIHCVFHNISNQKETELELSHLVNSIPGGIASYRLKARSLSPPSFLMA